MYQMVHLATIVGVGHWGVVGLGVSRVHSWCNIVCGYGSNSGYTYGKNNLKPEKATKKIQKNSIVSRANQNKVTYKEFHFGTKMLNLEQRKKEACD